MIGYRMYNRLAGPTTFSENSASRGGGAIFNQEVSGSNSQEDYEIPVITLPDDVVFLNNTARVRHWYVKLYSMAFIGVS